MSFDPFQPFAANGFLPDLLPIVPPGAHLSPYGNLTPDHLGKTPAIPTEDGYVGYTAWPVSITTKEKLKAWQGAANGSGPPNVGLNARGLHALDFDTHDPKAARLLFDVCMRLIPDVMRSVGIRIGRAPGFLFPFQPETPHRKSRLRFQDQGGAKSAVELLGVGQQYVIAGMHPSGKPYEWKPVGGGVILPVQRRDKIVTLSDDRLGLLLAGFQRELEAHGYTLIKPAKARLAGGASDGAPGAESLSAPSLEAVAAALASLPNRPGDKRDYDEWITVLHAVAGATGKSPEGRELWLRWSAEWDDGAGADAAAQSRWNTVNLGQVGIGWPWLQERASAENPDFRQAVAAEDFSADDPEPVTVTDGGLFDHPQKDLPDAEDIEAALDLLNEGDSKAANDIVRMLADSRLSLIEIDRYLKQIKEISGIGMGVLREALRAFSKHALKYSPDVAVNLAMTTLHHFGIGRLAFYNGAWFAFGGRDAPWQTIKREAIYRVMLGLVQGNDRLMLSGSGQKQHVTTMIEHAFKALIAATHTVLAKLDTEASKNHSMIPCRNGTLVVRADGNHELKPHDPADCFTYQLPIDYDPLASGKLWDETLRDLTAKTSVRLRSGDPDWSDIKEQVDRANASEKKPLHLSPDLIAWRNGTSYHLVDLADNARMLNELFGYTLVPLRFARIITVLQGNGSNGKSALVRAFASLIQSQTMITVLNTLAGRFTLGELQNRLLMYLDEGPDKSLPNDLMKTLVENQWITADVKFQGTKTFYTTVHPIISINGHLHISDTSQGMAKRLLMMDFNRVYTAEDRKSEPWPRLLSDENEKSAMLNRLVDGLTDVLQRREVKPCKASLQAFDDWQKRNKPEAKFIEQWCMTEQPPDERSEGESMNTLHGAYGHWYVQHHGRDKFMRDKARFGEVLEQMGFEKYEAGGKIRFRGLWLDTRKAGVTSFTGTEFEALY